MRILIDIGHPAHVHYFRNFTLEIQKKGHNVLFAARDRGEIIELLESYDFNYFNRGKGYDFPLFKVLNLLRVNYQILKKSILFKPDIFLGFGSIYGAQVSKLLRKPCIVFTDTELSNKELLFSMPFTDLIFTPAYFRKDLGKKQIKFNSLMELSYLHPKWYNKNSKALRLIGLNENSKYVIIRFVAFKAFHDRSIVGFTNNRKIELVNKLKQHAKIFISSEQNLPEELEKYRLNIPARYLHDIIANASLYVGDSGTTTTEACCLGIPSIRCNTFAKSKKERANFIYLEKKGLLFNFNEKDVNKAIEKAVDLIKSDDLRKKWKTKWNVFMNENIDTTSFLLWVIENYPKSIVTLKGDPNYQARFK